MECKLSISRDQISHLVLCSFLHAPHWVWHMVGILETFTGGKMCESRGLKGNLFVSLKEGLILYFRLAWNSQQCFYPSLSSATITDMSLYARQENFSYCKPKSLCSKSTFKSPRATSSGSVSVKKEKTHPLHGQLEVETQVFLAVSLNNHREEVCHPYGQ